MYFKIPETEEMLVPLLAYHIAVDRGCAVDMPRNLAKSVTWNKRIILFYSKY
ncbi:MAG: hypothetical protein J7J72_07290 [Bacteroidales bacterium]|nr:hypothetical protein [Bacteroidales bacterium]